MYCVFCRSRQGQVEFCEAMSTVTWTNVEIRDVQRAQYLSSDLSYLMDVCICTLGTFISVTFQKAFCFVFFVSDVGPLTLMRNLVCHVSSSLSHLMDFCVLICCILVIRSGLCSFVPDMVLEVWHLDTDYGKSHLVQVC